MTGRRFEVRREVELPADPETVWAAVATGEGQAAWFMPAPDLDPGTPGVDRDPPHRLAITTPAAPDGSLHAFEYLVEARGGGASVLRFVHSGVMGEDWSDEFEDMTAAGWDMYLHTLAQYLRLFAGRPAVYAEAEGPASSADPAWWGALLDRLGRPVLGEEVSLPVGDEVLTGEVDYAAPRFLGVRTADSLVRLHGRWPIGMVVAVSEHRFAAGADRDWTAFLAAAD